MYVSITQKGGYMTAPNNTPQRPTTDTLEDLEHKWQKPRLVTIDGIPATVIAPRIFKKSGKLGWYSQQPTVIDGKNATIQVLVYFNE